MHCLLLMVSLKNVDILMISERKLDDSFPTAKFFLHCFSVPYRPDRNSKGIMLYIREDIPSRFLSGKLKTGIETVLLRLI